MVVMSENLAQEKVWLNKFKYSEAERKYYEKLYSDSAKRENSSGRKRGSIEAPRSTANGGTDAAPQSSDPAPRSNKSNRNKSKKIHFEDSSKNDKGATNEKRDNSSGRKRVPSKSNDAEAEAPIEAPRTPQSKTPAASVPAAAAPQTNEPAPPRSNKSNKNKNKKAHFEVSQEGSVRGHNNGTGHALSLDALASEVARARYHIKTSLECMDDIAHMTSGSSSVDQANRIAQLEKNNSQLKNQVQDLVSVIGKLEARIAALELGKGASAKSSAPAKSPAPAKASAPPADDDDVDLFGSESEEEDDAAKKVKEQRLAEYAARKSKKPVLIAKSNIILDVKPWDDETDMKAMEKSVREITMDGLIWGASKLVPLAYGIHKLQISCVVEDDKVSVDLLTETIEGIEDYVQSVDIAAFNKV